MTHSQDTDSQPEAILETVVYCDDLGKARHFYEKVIGPRLVSIEPHRHLFFAVGGGMLLVFNPNRTREESVPVGNQVIPQHGSNGPSHFAFQIGPEQIESVTRNLSDHNVAIEAEIAWPGGGRSIYCRDPCGNSVEFATRNLWFKSP